MELRTCATSRRRRDAQLRPRGARAAHRAAAAVARDPGARGRARDDAVPARHARRDADARRRRAASRGARLLRDAEAFRDGARQYAAGEAGTLAIGFVSTAAYNVLPRIVPAFRAHRPGVRLLLREATSDAQIPELVAGEIDVGFVIAASVPPPLAYAALTASR
jgi:hypothetical protein